MGISLVVSSLIIYIFRKQTERNLSSRKKRTTVEGFHGPYIMQMTTTRCSTSYLPVPWDGNQHPPMPRVRKKLLTYMVNCCFWHTPFFIITDMGTDL